MKKITVTFRCDCGYIRTAEVIQLKYAFQIVNDIIQFGKIYLMAKEHAHEIHGKNLNFSLFSFVLNQRTQRKFSKRQIEKLKVALNNNEIDPTSPELENLINKMNQAAKQKDRYEQWKNYLNNSKVG